MKGAVLVTGAGKRVGAAIARRLGADGWLALVHYNSSAEDAEAVAHTIRAAGGRAQTVKGDLSSETETAALCDALTKRGDWVGLVNSAATFVEDRIDTFAYGPAEQQLRVNLIAPVYLARRLAAAGKGQFVVNIADQKVINPNPDYLSYTLAKLALAHATLTLSMALAPIRVNTIAPGLLLPSGPQTPAEFERVHDANTLTGKGATPEDVANAVAFLAANDAMTGALLPVDGGQHLVPSPRDVMFT